MVNGAFDPDQARLQGKTWRPPRAEALTPPSAEPQAAQAMSRPRAPRLYKWRLRTAANYDHAWSRALPGPESSGDFMPDRVLAH